MLKNFSFDVAFKKDTIEDCLVIFGEVTNKSNRDYSSIVFRIVIFSKEMPLGHINITINGLSNGKTQRFEKMIHKLAYSEVIHKITNYEAYFEGGY